MDKEKNKEYHREYMKKWRKKNPERNKEIAKQSRDKRKRKRNEYNKKYRQQNKNKLLPQHKEWYKNNKKKVLDYNKRYKIIHPIKTKRWAKKSQQKYIKQNKELSNKRSLADYYKNKKLWISRYRTRRIVKRDPTLIKKVCKKCKSRKNLEFHHEIYPLNYDEIRKAIKNEKIYYLCIKHHSKIKKKCRKRS